VELSPQRRPVAAWAEAQRRGVGLFQLGDLGRGGGEVDAPLESLGPALPVGGGGSVQSTSSTYSGRLYGPTSSSGAISAACLGSAAACPIPDKAAARRWAKRSSVSG